MKRIADQTLYEILEIPQDASSAAVAAAAERARALYGPGSLATYSLMSPDESAALVARIDEARTTLLDPEARKRYDASLASQAGEVRAVVNAPLGGNGVSLNGINGIQGTPPPTFTPVPVIPALKPASAPSAAVAPAEPSPPEAPQAAAPLPLTAPAAVAPPAAPRAPIRLDREVQPSVPAPAPAPGAPRAPAPAAAAQAPVAGPEVPMPEGALWTGEALRRVREARGITVQQIAERTKVTRHHVENIEAERYGALPAPVYLRGILLSIARELRLDGQKVARSYLERAAASGQLAKTR